MAATWQRLGDAVGCTTVGVNRVRIEPGRLSTPPHSHGASEELVFVLGGSGLSWQDEQVYELRPGDCIVHLADHEEHTLHGGPDGLEVLICGTRHPTELGWLPRSKAIRLGWPWVEGRTDDPWEIEAEAPPLELGDPAPRPTNIVNVDDAEPLALARGDSELEIRYLAREAGASRTGMRHYTIAAGKLDGEPHCHASEVEFFLVLDGDGAVLLGEDEIPLRPGSFVGRPPGTGVAHAFRGPLTLITYGTNEPGEVCYYPRSGKLKFWGVDAQIDAEPLTRFWD
ncbi:MAG TPA: cupin domain-containing protein [Gaiellaceae bacterium]